MRMVTEIESEELPDKVKNLINKTCSKCEYVRRESPNRGACVYPNSDVGGLIAILKPIPYLCPLNQ